MKRGHQEEPVEYGVPMPSPQLTQQVAFTCRQNLVGQFITMCRRHDLWAKTRCGVLYIDIKEGNQMNRTATLISQSLFTNQWDSLWQPMDINNAPNILYCEVWKMDVFCHNSDILKLPSLFAVWLFWTFHIKSHNMSF